MSDLYSIADQLIAEMARLRESGTTGRTLMQYKNRILDYIELELKEY